jgi:hypothetical protein
MQSLRIYFPMLILCPCLYNITLRFFRDAFFSGFGSRAGSPFSKQLFGDSGSFHSPHVLQFSFTLVQIHRLNFSLEFGGVHTFFRYH